MFVNVGLSEEYSQAATCGVGALSVIMTIVVVSVILLPHYSRSLEKHSLQIYFMR